MKTKEFIKGKVFIIPNPVGTIDEFLIDADKVKANKLMSANGIEFEKRANEKLVQVWFCTPGNDDSNWVCHEIDGYEELKGWRPILGFLPASLLKGKDDGDTITINMPISSYDKDEEIYKETTIKVQLILDQKSHRYRSYGSFAETLLKTLGY